MTEIIQKDKRYQKKKPEIAQRFINLGKEEIKSKINENKAKKNKNKSKIMIFQKGIIQMKSKLVQIQKMKITK